MKKIILQVAFLLFLTASVYSQNIYCVNSIKDADLKVYLVDNENQADLCVYFTNSENQAAGINGKWNFVAYENEASLKIFFTNQYQKSDLKIFFVDSESKAGWKNKQKQSILK